MCENHGLVDDNSWIRKKIMYIYSQWIDDTLGFYLFLGSATMLPVVGPIVRYFACQYGKYFHGGRVADPAECFDIIDKASVITVVDCACRKKIQGCDAPLNACIMVNTGAEVFSEIKGRSLISREAAKEIISRSFEAGLIRNIHHCFTPNTYSICNCCTCCCVPYKLRKDYMISTAVVNGNKIPLLNTKQCRKCMRCAVVCPEGAIEPEKGHVREDKCLGCGLCINACKEGALQMVHKERASVLKPGSIEKFIMYFTFIMFILPLAAGYKVFKTK